MSISVAVGFYLCACVLSSHLNVTTETAGAFSFTLAARPGDGRGTEPPPFAVSVLAVEFFASEVPKQIDR